ncbi:MAG: tetratricopeptide repeat protein [Flavobacteriaceae bacterium]
MNTTLKYILIALAALISYMGFAQDNEAQKQALLAAKQANTFVYEGNNLVGENDFVAAEMAYRQALSQQSSSAVGAYNLGNAYINNGSMDEALFRLQEAAKTATSKTEKHKAYHNIGNVLMQNKKCQEAVDAYKNALRNNPADNETRYNLGLAKQCAEQQKDQNQDDKNDQNKDNNQDQNQDQQNKDNQDKKEEGNDKQDENKDPKDEGDKDKNEGDQDKDEEGKPKDDKNDQGKGNEKEQEQPQQPQPRQGQLSPQQAKNLLEAMNNQEQKVQEKMNAEKVQGVIMQTDKDW